jgi:hypothetical protein
MPKTATLPAAIEQAFTAWLWLEGRIVVFPAHARRGLGLRLAEAATDVLDALNAAAYAGSPEERSAGLRRANQRLATWRLLVRGAHELRHLSHDQHAFHAEALGRLGADIGRWLNAVRRKAP